MNSSYWVDTFQLSLNLREKFHLLDYEIEISLELSPKIPTALREVLLQKR